MQRFLNGLYRLLELLAALLFLLIFVVILSEIVCRTFLGFSLLWSTDFCLLTVCWMLAFGMSAAFYRSEHLRIDFIRNQFPPRLGALVDVVILALTLAFFLVLIPMGWGTAMTKMKIVYTSLRWPTGYAYLALPVMAAFSSVFLLWQLKGALCTLLGRRAAGPDKEGLS
ncbi:TRAP transporter small permease [Flavonifractor hominis]|uniref:TRAP transporter small permease n=1 Tax=Flavonifractor hominis TaxID=3133178 RepID=A0ABV1ERT8_9FIRM